jgi:hypothetical protein
MRGEPHTGAGQFRPRTTLLAMVAPLGAAASWPAKAVATTLIGLVVLRVASWTVLPPITTGGMTDMLACLLRAMVLAGFLAGGLYSSAHGRQAGRYAVAGF